MNITRFFLWAVIYSGGARLALPLDKRTEQRRRLPQKGVTKTRQKVGSDAVKHKRGANKRVAHQNPHGNGPHKSSSGSEFASGTNKRNKGKIGRRKQRRKKNGDKTDNKNRERNGQGRVPRRKKRIETSRSRKITRQGCKLAQGYYPNFDDETCIQDDNYPNYMKTDVDFYFASEINACCRLHYKGRVKDCILMSEQYADRWGGSDGGRLPNPDKKANLQGCKPLYGYYPNFDDETCLRDDTYPNYMKTDIDFYFAGDINQCCRLHYRGRVKDCIGKSERHEGRWAGGGWTDSYTVVGYYNPAGGGKPWHHIPTGWRTHARNDKVGRETTRGVGYENWSGASDGSTADRFQVVGQYHPRRGGKPLPRDPLRWQPHNQEAASNTRGGKARG